MNGKVVGKIERIDSNFNRFLERRQNRYLTQAMESITDLGSFHFSFLLLLILWFSGEYQVFLSLSAGYLAAWIPVYIIKHKVKRERPENHIDNLLEGSSFPSGHSATVFAAAVILSAFYGMKSIFFLTALTVAFSRLYLEDHFLSDVVVGSAIGLGVATFTMTI